MDPVTRRLRSSLTVAIRERNADAVAALKSTLAAIANAEAVSAPDSSAPRVGLGAGEASRRQLSPDEISGIVRGEVAERIATAAEYERLGRHAQARRLRGEAAVLEEFL